MQDIFIVDPEFPQVAYSVPEEELVKKLETDKILPEWWKNYYQDFLIKKWKARDTPTLEEVCKY